MLLSICVLLRMSESGPQANSLHCGLLAPHRFRLSVSDCSCVVAVLVPQHSTIDPPVGRLLVDVIPPSMNEDCTVPARTSFQRGVISRSCTIRSTAASAA